ncbi:galactose oxidase [Punctularia strigosozonata HHB-11173 SS5]|uniref:Galactose oxidase n=1 Tax=Punctularia strigosozonata (strain HHB-11173) TaxID=741275 RepID=R7S591_PUNST|nr:galactose oxidase [Punctularia strigosozonata HHB-11173 SS5]EIN04521.1 galactose oxidase [Punctularia strigosozonata HHB-11173 SS5]
MSAPSAALFVSSLLSVTNAVHIVPRHSFSSRASVPTKLPGNWTSKGCWTDDTGSRTLGAASFTDTANMTVENCISFCDKQSFIFAGIEFAQECYCDNFIKSSAAQSPLTDCSDACTGNPNETCGNANRLNVFFSGGTPPPAPSTIPSVGLWKSLGCYNDSTANRVLGNPAAPVGAVTVETCTTACFNAGFPLAGMEYADECYCDAAIENGGAPTPLGDCDMTCAGNSTEFCGGSNRLNVYNYTGTDLPPRTPGNNGGGGGGGGNNGAPVFPVLSGLPSGWTYAACYVDNANGRVFTTELNDNPTLTVEGCINSCRSQNFTLAGMEFADQCFCGNTLVNGATVATDPTTCNMGCAGNTTEACGGPSRLSVYTSTAKVTALPVPTVLNSSLPGNWKFQGCLMDGATRVFPYQNIWTNNNTVEACLTQCSDFGYPAAGMEFGDECWCGDVSDVTNNPNGGLAPETDCSAPCSGDPIHLCGGANRLQYYQYEGGLQTWHTPSNIGRYEFLIGGVVVPLLATVGINNKVSFLEKFPTSEFGNSTGAYELDLSLVDNFDLAWRTMHVQSDVFCSAAIVLPDKAARILNVGGWSLTSTFGVRMYAPDGSPGVNSTNDWEENPQELLLQRGRWYPSAVLLANGSVLVVGGETGSNAPADPTLEVLPTPAGGPTWLFMDWLNRTDPNNLYPFLHILPSHNIFVGYYNEARILEPVTFTTVKTLPNMPGAVNNFLAGRTYPMEGTAVMFPQHAPYTDPVTILVCGGSNGVAAPGLDSCLSIQPEVTNAAWTLERMPSTRVMPCMVALPDGTFMILNGAHTGVAGFGLADDPNLTAVLYDPSQPVNSRMSILNTTIVARLYHSEATLLPDGRVLVSGSDPESQPPQDFPQEFRIEVYIPPYLNQGFKQPTFTITETDWEYGGTYQIKVQLFQGTTSTMRVSLIAATSSTHGNMMGGRTIFPAFSCSGTTCTITAPPSVGVAPAGWFQLFVLDGPTPSHSQWVRIGGDPGRLGNWPDLPGFTLPGI